MRRLLKPLVLLGGGAWAAAVVLRADLPGAWRSLAEATSTGQWGWLLLLFLMPSALASWLDTRGWIASFGRERPPASFSKLFGVRLAGEAVNQATPFLSLGGEPLKVLLTIGPGIHRGDSAASVIAARCILTLTQALYAALAVLLVPPAWTSRTGLSSAFAAFPVVLLSVLLALLLSHLAFPWYARRLLERHPFLRKHATSLGVLGRALGFWRTHPREFAAAFLCFLAGWAVVAGEFWLVARVLGQPLSWSAALVLEGLMNLVTMATFFIPGNLGSQEAGLLYVARLCGLGTPFGALMVVLRRAREAFWIVAGLGCLALLGSRTAGRPRALAGPRCSGD